MSASEAETVKSAKRQLVRLPFGAPVAEVMAVIARDGGLILEGVLTPQQLDELNADIDAKLNAMDVGLPEQHIYDAVFHGDLTKRIANLPMVSRVFREEIMANPVTLSYQDAMLNDEADNYWLTSAQVIELYPGQTKQFLHRDFESWPYFRSMASKAPEIATNFLIALTDSTEEMGATRVVPGSHLWDDFQDRDHHEDTVPAAMKAGDGLLTTAKLLHGGGANRSDRKRRIVAMAYNVGWLTPEEAYPFLIPLEVARTLPPRAQQLIGFRSFPNPTRGGTLWSYEMKELADALKL